MRFALPTLLVPTLVSFDNERWKSPSVFPSRLPFNVTKFACWPELLPPSVFEEAIPLVASPLTPVIPDFTLSKIFLLMVKQDDFLEVVTGIFSFNPSVQLVPLSKFPSKFTLPMPDFDAEANYFAFYCKRLAANYPDPPPPPASIVHYLRKIGDFPLPHPCGALASLFPLVPGCRLISFHVKELAVIWAGNCLTMLATVGLLRSPPFPGLSIPISEGDHALSIGESAGEGVLPHFDLLSALASSPFERYVGTGQGAPAVRISFRDNLARERITDWGAAIGLIPSPLVGHPPSGADDDDLLPVLPSDPDLFFLVSPADLLFQEDDMVLLVSPPSLSSPSFRNERRAPVLSPPPAPADGSCVLPSPLSMLNKNLSPLLSVPDIASLSFSSPPRNASPSAAGSPPLTPFLFRGARLTGTLVATTPGWRTMRGPGGVIYKIRPSWLEAPADPRDMGPSD